MDDNIEIAKDFTVGDWKNLREKLFEHDNYDAWTTAKNAFKNRINARFFDPIEKIKEGGLKTGEGFSITLIASILLETFAAFELGRLYSSKSTEIGPHQYSGSQILINDFFKKEFFKGLISSKAKEKYFSFIRCPLVHEAKTDYRAIIIANDGVKNIKPMEFFFKVEGKDEFRLNRDLFVDVLKNFFEDYLKRLMEPSNIHLRNSFIMKFDEISGINHCWYFVYGSNLNNKQLNDRLSELKTGLLQEFSCSTDGYSFKYNKRSKDGTAKANLVKENSGVVNGKAVLLDKDSFKKFMDDKEKGYESEEIAVSYFASEKNKIFKCFTAISSNLTTAAPSREYVKTIIDGANENNLPDDYIAKFINYPF
jgi:hypothetical protein